MKCPYCKAEILDTLDYCPNCGQKINGLNGYDTKDYLSRAIENDEKYKRKINNYRQELKSRQKKCIVFCGVVVTILVFISIFFSVIRPAMLYSKGRKYIEEHKYQEAEEKFEKLPEYYKDGQKRADESRYLQAELFYEEGKYHEAIEKLNEISYHMNDEIGPKCIQALLKEANIGQEIQFGVYEQDVENFGDENINWIILDKEEDKVLLLSKNVLECKAFHDKRIEISWENCTLREWLNNDFLNEAFSNNEINIINTSDVSADVNPHDDYHKVPGNSTQDKIFLLSINEVENYFGEDVRSRCSIPTEYVRNQFERKGTDAHCNWWLRTPGAVCQDEAVNINSDGSINYGGTAVDEDGFFERIGVRPALWINLEHVDLDN